ncbi:DUF4124 domain-containing protein [uncultured Lamprocystis sp.]|uniref:DUF4124 domain-containing protein n=1 Tax=uncultured Lamprocystis sp. TaxID=543132 RepID=UPI0025ED23AC|nr:DUF4124 domain-containing protein [uncultured Lamprocystis sp.]
MAKPLSSMSLVLTLGISIAALNSPNPATAAIYRCTNAAGEVGFSDEPCPTGVATDELDIQSRPSRRASGRTADDNPYSAIEQVKRLEREQGRHKTPRRDAANPDHHARLRDIKEQLRTLARGERNLRDDLGGDASPIRKRWAREELATLLEQQAQLRRERDLLSGRRPRTADIERRARKDALEAESVTRAAQARAEQAQREAQLRSQEAKKQAQAEEQRANAKSWHTKEPQP